MNKDKPKLIVLLGPTAAGKTKMSVRIAKQFNCEIISGDSMQVYRGMDIGTAKITAAEQESVPHHMIDVHDPDYLFSVADFQHEVKQAIKRIHQKGKIPFIVGGTGLYIESVIYDYQFKEVSSDPEFRKAQEIFAEKYGNEGLHQKLQQVDPETAARLHPNDQRRIIRALEVFHLTGQTMGEQKEKQKQQSPYHLCLLGLTMDRAKLYARIEQRIDLMMQQGLVEEVRALLQQGYHGNLTSMQAIGYKEIVKYIEGAYNLEEAIYLLKRDTRRFAKRQLSWFRHMNEIQWIDVTKLDKFSEHLQKIHAIITETFFKGNRRENSINE